MSIIYGPIISTLANPTRLLTCLPVKPKLRKIASLILVRAHRK